MKVQKIRYRVDQLGFFKMSCFSPIPVFSPPLRTWEFCRGRDRTRDLLTLNQQVVQTTIFSSSWQSFWHIEFNPIVLYSKIHYCYGTLLLGSNYMLVQYPICAILEEFGWLVRSNIKFRSQNIKKASVQMKYQDIIDESVTLMSK